MCVQGNLTRNTSKAGADGNTPPRTAESHAESHISGEDGEHGEQVCEGVMVEG